MRFDAHGLHAEATSTRLDGFDPRARVLCALALAVVLASLQSFPPLLCGSVIPLILLLWDEGGMLRGVLPRLNVVGLFVALILTLTYPGERLGRVFSAEGLRLALLVVLKLNVISILLIRMVVALGVERIENVLARFGLSEKLRVLLLLTTRCIFLLAERTETMVRAVHLRAPELRGTLMFKAFACMLGTTLLHSSDRAERTMLAIRCRGGLSGFSQCRPLCWRGIDTLLCLFFGLNIAVILSCCLLWRP